MKSYSELESRLVKTWKTVSNSIGKEFARKYYGKDSDLHWIAGCIDTAMIGDSYWSVQQMVDALDAKLTRDQVWNYDAILDGTVWYYKHNLKKNGKR